MKEQTVLIIFLDHAFNSLVNGCGREGDACCCSKSLCVC